MRGDRKKIGIFVIILGLIIIIAIVYFLINQQRETSPVKPAEGDQTEEPYKPAETNPGNAPVNYQRYDISQEEVKKTSADDLGKLAMSIAERFGSFSNQSNYSNFTDLKIVMTTEMGAWVDTYIEDLRNQSNNTDNVYYGITTKAINYQINSFDEKAGKADVLVFTQRQESTETIGGGEAYNQDVRIVFEREGDDNWLFDAAYWSKE